jgi:hypothetical protein
MFVLIPTSVFATTPENIEPGDTFIYSVKEWDVPYEDLIPMGEDPPFDLSQLILDLSGSTLGVKVMEKYSNGFYLLDIYVVLGKTIEIPLPADAPPEMAAIFGDSLDLAAGVGIGLGSLPGSDMTDTSIGGGIPWYLNPNEWDTYETEIVSGIAPSGMTVDVTNTGDTFLVEISGSGEGMTAQLSLEWYRTGDIAGVFKMIAGSLDGDFNGDGSSDHIEISISHDSNEHNPLPDFILDRGELTLTMTTADFTSSATGLFDDPNVIEGFNQITDAILNMEGKEVIKYDVKSVRGCYYQTDMSMYDPSTGSLTPSEGGPWWNGFTGMTTYSDTMTSSPTDYYGFTVALFPQGAPGITPDWDMWKASTKSISELFQLIENGVMVGTGDQAFSDMGFTLNEFDVTYEMRYSKDFVFFFGEASVDLEFAAADAVTPPEGTISTTAGDLDADGQIWISYKDDGTLAGAGVSVNVSLSVTDIPFYDEMSGTIYESGSINAELNIEVQSDKVSSIPDPEEAGTEPSDDGGLIPGFTMVPVLMVMAAIVVIVRKRK